MKRKDRQVFGMNKTNRQIIVKFLRTKRDYLCKNTLRGITLSRYYVNMCRNLNHLAAYKLHNDLTEDLTYTDMEAFQPLLTISTGGMLLNTFRTAIEEDKPDQTDFLEDFSIYKHISSTKYLYQKIHNTDNDISHIKRVTRSDVVKALNIVIESLSDVDAYDQFKYISKLLHQLAIISSDAVGLRAMSYSPQSIHVFGASIEKQKYCPDKLYNLNYNNKIIQKFFGQMNQLCDILNRINKSSKVNKNDKKSLSKLCSVIPPRISKISNRISNIRRSGTVTIDGIAKLL